jgi:sulfatase maturation enzyme AslB (radical SAM superfamily)
LIDELADSRFNANIALTVTPSNHEQVIPIYKFLKAEHSVTSFSAIAMREQGVVQLISSDTKKLVQAAYSELTQLIENDIVEKAATGYRGGLIARLLNVKNFILYDILRVSYSSPGYRSRCPSATMFGVIGANGDVFPCEVLEGRCLGNLRDYDLNFRRLWGDRPTRDCAKFVVDTKCNCTYECAYGINIISNLKYAPRLLLGLVKSYLR